MNIGKLKDVQAILFDMDGVVLDSMPLWMEAGAIYLRSLGKNPEENLGRKLFAMTMTEAAKYFNENYGVNKTRDEVSAGIDDVMIKEYKSSINLKKDSGVFLKALHEAGIKIYVATSSNRQMVINGFTRNDILKYVDGIFPAEEVGVGKSKPEYFIRVSEKIGVKFEEMYLFEDGLYSIEVAKKLGIRTVGVYDEASLPDQERMKEICDIYIKEKDNYYDLLD